METIQSLLIALIRVARAGHLTAQDFERVVRRQFLIENLLAHNLNLCATARDIGVHRNTLTRQLHDLDINIGIMRREMRHGAFKKSAVSERLSVPAIKRA